MWVEKVIDDSDGLYSEPFLFYFSKGRHTLRFVSVKEPVAIDYIKIFNLKDIPYYREVMKEEHISKSNFKNIIVKIQGEKAHSTKPFSPI